MKIAENFVKNLQKLSDIRKNRQESVGIRRGSAQESARIGKCPQEMLKIAEDFVKSIQEFASIRNKSSRTGRKHSKSWRISSRPSKNLRASAAIVGKPNKTNKDNTNLQGIRMGPAWDPQEPQSNLGTVKVAHAHTHTQIDCWCLTNELLLERLGGNGLAASSITSKICTAGP